MPQLLKQKVKTPLSTTLLLSEAAAVDDSKPGPGLDKLEVLVVETPVIDKVGEPEQPERQTKGLLVVWVELMVLEVVVEPGVEEVMETLQPVVLEALA